MKAKTSTTKIITYVFWKVFDRNQKPIWSMLHRTVDGIDTLCKVKVRPQQTHHFGIKNTKKAPRHHVLSICQICNSEALKSTM